MRLSKYCLKLDRHRRLSDERSCLWELPSALQHQHTMWLFNSSYYFICTVYTHTRIQIEFSPAFRLASSCWIAKIFVRVDSHSQCCCSADKWSIKNSIVCSLAFPSEFCAWRWAPRLFVDLNTKSYTHIVCICTGGMKKDGKLWMARERKCVLLMPNKALTWPENRLDSIEWKLCRINWTKFIDMAGVGQHSHWTRSEFVWFVWCQ